MFFRVLPLQISQLLVQEPIPPESVSRTSKNIMLTVACGGWFCRFSDEQLGQGKGGEHPSSDAPPLPTTWAGNSRGSDASAVLGMPALEES